ncbi:hypothetical protein AB0D04_40860 [Streptomyces sp. NPDC048483]|uniref:NucA/NucB deoxyribonuclease domain-containing protein n=1 Tax=Streptomyces sp. NPDC048483 TaxID=3154927 RepID=UPI00341E68E8
MRWRAKTRTKTLIAAALAFAIGAPATAAAVPEDQAPAKRTPAQIMNTKTVTHDGQTYRTGDIGLTKKTLADLRAKGKKARVQGLKSLPTTDSAPTPTKPLKRLQPDAKPLTVNQGYGQSRKEAAAPAGDTAPATAGAPATTSDSPNNHQGWDPIGTRPPADRLEACLKPVKFNSYRTYNRFTHCGYYGLALRYWEVDSNGVPVELEGTTYIKVKVFGQGDPKQRRTRIFSTVDKGSIDYEWGLIDDWWTAPGIPFTLEGVCNQPASVCNSSPGGYSAPAASWDNNPSWVHWDIHNFENGTQGRDKISFNRWHVRAYTDQPADGYKTVEPADIPSRLQRCDSADYMVDRNKKYPKACIFPEAVPFLTYTLGSDHDEIARHLRAAFNNPNNTYPLPAAPGEPPKTKKIPGRYTGTASSPGLHRITEKLHEETYKDNRRHKDGACFYKGRYKDLYKDTGLPPSKRPDKTKKEECDEYPFASTVEGAASKKWDFSVRAASRAHNKRAGNILRVYYLEDRMLAWDETFTENGNDQFFMRIK